MLHDCSLQGIYNVIFLVKLTGHRNFSDDDYQGVFGESVKVKWRGTWVVKTVIKSQIYHPVKMCASYTFTFPLILFLFKLLFFPSTMIKDKINLCNSRLSENLFMSIMQEIICQGQH